MKNKEKKDKVRKKSFDKQLTEAITTNKYKKIVGRLSGLKILSNPLIPKDEVWFVNENRFRFRRPRKVPKYVFRLFGRLINIYIDNL